MTAGKTDLGADAVAQEDDGDLDQLMAVEMWRCDYCSGGKSMHG